MKRMLVIPVIMAVTAVSVALISKVGGKVAKKQFQDFRGGMENR